MTMPTVGIVSDGCGCHDHADEARILLQSGAAPAISARRDDGAPGR